MTDIYGIGDSLRAQLGAYEQSARRFGRTSRMLMLVEDGDYVVAPSGSVANSIRDKLKQMGVKADVFSCDTNLGSVADRLPNISNGRIHFDHTWVEAYFRDSIEVFAHSLDRFTFERSRLHSLNSEWKSRVRRVVT